MRTRAIRRRVGMSSIKPQKSLIEVLKKHSGRDNKGHVSTRHQGGRQKRYYRIIDFKRSIRDVEGVVKTVEYDPNRFAYISLVEFADGKKCYILQPKDLKAGDVVMAGESVPIKIGNALPLKNIPLGMAVHNIELRPGQGGKMVRGAGNTATVLSKDAGYVQIKLPSGEVRKFYEDCYATIGTIGNVEHRYDKIGSAGRARLMGRRPGVRGVAQHPGSHPHGGGEGRSGEGMHPKTPWGKPARGKRTRNRYRATRKLIVTQRKK